MEISSVLKLLQGDYVTVSDIAKKTYYTPEQVEDRFQHLVQIGVLKPVGEKRYVPQQGIDRDTLRKEFFNDFSEMSTDNPDTNTNTDT